MYPEERWRAGQYRVDIFRVKTPIVATSGVARARGGLLRGGGKRIQSDSADGSNAPVLVEIPVQDPSPPPTP